MEYCEKKFELVQVNKYRQILTDNIFKTTRDTVDARQAARKAYNYTKHRNRNVTELKPPMGQVEPVG